ncbi:MAG: polymerase subunit gamma/tau [Acidobacteriota bacterium]|jgi:DNA polymerase-3 subunit gamma/tau|nr:polymerase subunit gamma/tau [Acidobacteriota bacterium]
MSYQVIARKWRPQTFDEVTGQEPITRTLKNAIEHERLHHAYLFSGARGVGKTTTARLLAKALNCHKSPKPTATPCRTDDPDACVSCREISESESTDVREIDAASNTGVDNVRDAIIGNVAYTVARDRYKVFIIDEVHMLSGAAFNALLKTLEEPPPRVVFIMATTEKHKLPETILSRCQQFEFRTIATTKIAERLREIANAEKVKISEEALREIARAGEGSMRDAQSAFDQVISFSGAEIKVEDVETALGLASTEMLSRVMGAIAEQGASEALAVVNDLVMRGHDLRNFCRDLLGHVRNLLVAKISGETAELLDTAATDRRELVRQANSFSESDLVRFFHSLTETENNLRIAAHPRYQLEVGLVKLMDMRRIVPLNNLIERLSALEESLRTGAPPATSKTPPASTGGGAQSSGGKPGASPVTTTPSQRAASLMTGEGAAVAARMQATADEPPFGGVDGTPPTSTLPTSTPPASPPVLTLVPPPGPQPVQAGVATTTTVSQPAFKNGMQQPERVGPAVPDYKTVTQDSTIESIKAALEKRSRMFLVIALEGARKALVEGNELYVEFAPEAKHLRDNLAKPESVKLLREVGRELLGHDIGVRIVVTDQSEQNEVPTKDGEARLEKQHLREVAEQDPGVQTALRTFRAEIVDVRKIEEQ